jgi:pimeloyl-ACP methyl ester carboxylesterase
MHLPPGFRADPDAHELVVVVHGTGRSAMAHRDALAPMADARRWVVLAPVFPAGVLGDGNVDGYKYLKEGELRYDLILLAIVDELCEVLRRDFPRFNLFGFSGGAHFAHRFFYLHPQRLSAVSIGAPGGVTRIDDTRDFWLGTRNLEALFGRPLDLAAMRRTRVQLLVGADDTEEFVYPPGYAGFTEGMAELGRNRVERSTTLLRNYQDHGLDVRQDIVPGAAHQSAPMLPHVVRFFAKGGA